ncbi:MAG: hypothetical protein ACOYOV_00180 [Bacteroidales bacterium]
MKYFKYVLIAILLHLTIVFFPYSPSYPQYITGSPPLMQYAVKVFADAKRLGYTPPKFNTLTLQFSAESPDVNKDTGNTTIGYTTGYNSDFPLITINIITWIQMNSEQRYLLIAHEMGHAIWKRDHDETLLPDFTQKSIMAPVMFNVDIFKKKRDYYLRELFDHTGDL